MLGLVWDICVWQLRKEPVLLLFVAGEVCCGSMGWCGEEQMKRCRWLVDWLLAESQAEGN